MHMVGAMQQAPFQPFATVTVRAGDFVTRFTGQIEYTERGVRISWLDSDIGPDDREPLARVTDVNEPHTIDWMSVEKYAVHEATVHETTRKNVEYLYRLAHWPEGYEPCRRKDTPFTSRDGFRRLSDGAVQGWYNGIEDAREGAWSDSDGPQQFTDQRADALDPGEALPLPLTRDGSIADVCR